MVSVAEALAQGTRHHQAGQLADAERIYRQVLAVEPDNPHALHFMGVLAIQSGQFSTAIDLIGRAIRVDRSQASFHANLGEAHRHSGDLERAIECYRAAVRLEPGLAQVHSLLGAALSVRGHHAVAAAALREALRLAPDDLQARERLGHVLVDLGKPDEAEICFRRVLRSQPRSAEAHYHLGGVLQSQGKLDEAASCYREGLALDPNAAVGSENAGASGNAQGAANRPLHVAARTNLGLIYDSLGRQPEADACYRAAIAADGRAVEPRYNLAALLQRQGRLDAAIACYEEALTINPLYVRALTGMSYALQMQGRLEAVVTCCERAIAVDPRCADAYNNLGAAKGEMGRRDEAIDCFVRAIALNGGYAISHSNLAVALQALGRLDESIAEHRRAVELAPNNAAFHSNLLYVLNYHPASSAPALYEEHTAWARRHADPLYAARAPHTNDRAPDRRLRLGYVSPHFLAHAVTFFSEPILAHHDHLQFEVFCYSDVSRGDETTERLRGYADQWRDTFYLGDAELHDLVRQDKIDILVDLTGHIQGGKRMLTFARKPAPVQVTYIGYQNTTGMRAMDYRLTDAWADPPGATDAFHTESLVRLPTTFFCYRPSPDAPEVGILPAIAAGHVTFGSFNSFAKVTPQALDTWATILLAVPRSRLVILADMTPSLRERLEQTFERRGVHRERLQLVNRLPRSRYLELISSVDVALDPFPFNGHTTTCDSLWQGVPVVTLLGETYVSRFGSSGLATLGLDELVTRSREEYIDVAVRLAGDLERLGQLRETLRQRMAASPLLDFAAFARNLEAAYRRMWRDGCAREPGQTSSS